MRQGVISDQPVAPTDDLSAQPARHDWGRVAVGAAFVAVLALLGMFGLKMAANAGWLQGGAGPRVAGAPGVNFNGQLVQTAFRQAPDFALTLFSGESLRLADLRGTPVVVNFWASWCPPCRQEAPLLERTWRAYRARGVTFVGVDIWDSDADARRFLRDFAITYPNGPDPGAVALDYGLTGIPETYFIDRDGQVVRKWIGPFTEESLRALLDELLAATG